jgi:diguanylate cyclase (GGDEF)-like protein
MRPARPSAVLEPAREHSLSSSVRGLFIVLAGLPLVVLIALLDHWSGRRLSLGLLYPIPVALAAWRGGLPCGLLVALAATGIWHIADCLSQPELSLAAVLVSGVVRFGAFTLVASLLGRLRLSLLHEKALARTDALTGAANGRTFYEAACLAIEGSLRSGVPLTLAYLDLDNFKHLNDRHGHAAGDEALRRAARAICANIRATDVLARLGGDEFALLLPGLVGEDVQALLDRLCRVVGQVMAAEGWPVTLSVGAATFAQPCRDIDLMLRRADAMLYRAKRGGKGRVEHELVLEPDRSQSRVERRVAARVLCGFDAWIRVGRSEGDPDDLACVRDISATGIGLQLQRRLPAGTLLAVDPLDGRGPRTVLAQALWSAPCGDGWLHGCLLAAPLGEEELLSWSQGRCEAPTAPLKEEDRRDAGLSDASDHGS